MIADADSVPRSVRRKPLARDVGQPRRVLIITDDARASRACSDAARLAELEVVEVTGLPDAVVAMAGGGFVGLVVHGLSTRELVTLAHLSLQRVMPPTVIVTDAVATLTLVIRAAALIVPSTPAASVVRHLVAMIDREPAATASRLPLRLVAAVSKWMIRLRVAPDLGP